MCGLVGNECLVDHLGLDVGQFVAFCQNKAFLWAVNECFDGIIRCPRCALCTFHVCFLLRHHFSVELVDFIDDFTRLVGGAVDARAQPGASAPAVCLGHGLVERVNHRSEYSLHYPS